MLAFFPKSGTCFCVKLIHHTRKIKLYDWLNRLQYAQLTDLKLKAVFFPHLFSNQHRTFVPARKCCDCELCMLALAAVFINMSSLMAIVLLWLRFSACSLSMLQFYNWWSIGASGVFGLSVSGLSLKTIARSTCNFLCLPTNQQTLQLW